MGEGQDLGRCSSRERWTIRPGSRSARGTGIGWEANHPILYGPPRWPSRLESGMKKRKWGQCTAEGTTRSLAAGTVTLDPVLSEAWLRTGVGPRMEKIKGNKRRIGGGGDGMVLVHGLRQYIVMPILDNVLVRVETLDP